MHNQVAKDCRVALYGDLVLMMLGPCRVGTGVNDVERKTIHERLQGNLVDQGQGRYVNPRCYKVTGAKKERPDVWVKDPSRSIVLQASLTYSASCLAATSAYKFLIWCCPAATLCLAPRLSCCIYLEAAGTSSRCVRESIAQAQSAAKSGVTMCSTQQGTVQWDL